MPEKRTLERAGKAKREGKAPSTQAGSFVKEEIDHIRKGKHGAKSTKQAIAIGLSKARRAGVKLKPAPAKKPSKPKKESKRVASKAALSKQTRSAAKKRSPTSRSLAAKKAAKTRQKRAS